MISIVKDTTVFSAFTEIANRNADRPFLRAPKIATSGYSSSAIEYSYKQTQQQVNNLRAMYQSLNLKPDDRVALAFDSRLDVYLHMLAVNALGASIVPLNMASSDTELRYVIDHSDTRLMSGATEYLERLRDLSADLESVSVFNCDNAASDQSLAEPLGNSNQEVALMYTSGTTGKPKGCILSNEYFLTMGREYNRLGDMCDIDSHDRLLTPLPPNHMNALSTSFMAMLLCGGCVIQLDRFHPRSWWQTVRDEGATVIHYLGVMPAILLTLEHKPEEDFSDQLKFGFGAGSDPRHQQVFEERFGFPLIEGWAMTETGGAGMIVANTEPRHLGQRCVGRPKAHVEYRIVDQADQDVNPGEDGELLVRTNGPNPRKGFFSAYYKDAQATEEGWSGGWWHTGDVVRQGPDSSLFFVDRRKNVIRRSGENIAAVEVEASLLQHHLVTNCAVTAFPDEIRGDEVFAFIVISENTPDLEAPELAMLIFNHSMQSLSYYKAPGFIVFTDKLPLTTSQKVSRAKLKEWALEHLESGQAHDMRSHKKRNRS